MIYAFPAFEKFLYFIKERHAIWNRRFILKEEQPWTKDKILRQYKFTNVYRELDRVTIWIAQHWRKPYKTQRDLWFAMVVARLVNHPDTMQELGVPLPWNPNHFKHVMKRRKVNREQCFSGAYIVSTGGKAMDKADYLAQFVLDPLWKSRAILRPRGDDTLSTYHLRLMQFDGLGSFMAAQIVADMKYVQPLLSAPDFWTWASSGPGSRRGMSYVMGKGPKEIHWKEHEWRDALGELHELVIPWIERWRYPKLHAQDLQNCLCEFSKYMRTDQGTGRPKSKFTPFGG